MTPEPDLTAAALRMAAALAAGFALLFAALWLVRRLMRTGMPGKGRRLQVLERVMLGQGHQAALLKAPGALLVVGMSRDRIQVLHTVTSPDESGYSDQTTDHIPDHIPHHINDIKNAPEGITDAPDCRDAQFSFSSTLKTALGRTDGRKPDELDDAESGKFADADKSAAGPS